VAKSRNNSGLLNFLPVTADYFAIGRSACNTPSVTFGSVGKTQPTLADPAMRGKSFLYDSLCIDRGQKNTCEHPVTNSYVAFY